MKMRLFQLLVVSIFVLCGVVALCEESKRIVELRVIEKEKVCWFNDVKIPLNLDENLIVNIRCNDDYDCYRYIEGLYDFRGLSYEFNPNVYCE